MSNRFHNKWHRASHHSYKDPTIIDAGWDPIASPDSPFQGDFVLADGSGGTQIGELYSKIIHTTKLTPESPEGQDWNADKIVVDTNLEVTKNITGDGDLYVSGNTSGKGWLKIDKYGDFGEYVHIHDQNNDGYGLIVDKKAYVSGETVLNDKTYVNHNGLFVTGDSIFNDDLNVSGNETIGEYVHILGAYPTATETYGGCGLVVDKKAYVSGETILNDKTYVNQNGLFVTGDSEFADNLTIDKNLYVTGNTMSAFIKSAKIEYADITSADIIKIDIHVGEKDGYILSGGLTGDDKTKVPESYVAGEHNLYLSGEGLISDSYVLFNAETRLTDVLNVSGETTINNKLTIQRYGADITGDVVLHNSLSVSGKSHFADEAEFLDDVKVSGDAFVNGTLNVTGDSTFVDTYTTGTATIKTLSVTGDSDLDGNLDVGGTLKVTGATTLNSTLNVSGETALKNTSIGGTLGVTGAVDFDSTLNVDGATTFGNTLNVTGKTTLSDELHVVKSITTERNLYVTGNAKVGAFGSFGTYVSAAGSDNNGYGLIIDKNGNIKGNTDIGGTLGVTGAVDFDSTLNVDGATTLNGGVTVKTSTSNKSMTFDGEKIYRKNGTQAAGTFLFPSYGGTLVARPNSPLPPSGNIPMFDEYGNIVDSGNDATDFYPMVEKTWEQLKAMRDDGTLVPGQRYRITDYVATTVQADTQSANHRFDIIVRADATNKLNENAYAIKNAEDTTYFVNSKLEAWELKYSLDNDTNRFAWADSANGKGVVYRLIDEFNNDCPYDFKGITMKAYGDTDNVFRYTFDSGAASNNTDYSLIGSTRNVYNNVIGTHLVSNELRLNRIIFKGNNCYSNTFWTGCYSNTFGDGCCSNTFKYDCHSNTFGDSFHTNTFGDGCYSNTFGNDCRSNTFGGYYSSNTFGDGCYFNTFGNYCSSNTFSDGCHSNIFGDYCSSNTFGTGCDYNTFGGHCTTNTFGNNCDSNTFRSYSDYNTFGNRCSSNTFGTGCDHISFKNNTATKNYVSNIIVEDGNRYITLNMTGTSTSSAPYRNVTLAAGLNNTTTNKTITDSTDGGQTFKTVFQPANSQVISV